MADFPHKQLLSDYFAGKCTALQKQWLNDWLKEPDNQLIYYQYLNEWESQHPQFLADIPAAVQKFRNEIRNNTLEKDTNNALPSLKYGKSIGFLHYLAACMLLLLISGGYFGRDLIRYQTYATNYAETKSFMLSDGSLIALNANSKLTVPRWGFGKSDRYVLLEGEAEFNVAHLPGHQKFTVRTSTDFLVEVLGTKFVMYARSTRRKVILSEGKVRVHYEPGKELLMKPGDFVDLKATGRLVKKTTAQPGDFADWKQHRFTFDKTTLAEIGQLIQDHFGYKIIIKEPNLAKRTVSGVFEAQKSTELIDALADLLHLTANETPAGIELSSTINSAPNN